MSGSVNAVRAAFHDPNHDDSETVDFPDDWKDFEDHFFVSQHDKCGYCESQVRAATNGDVEHYYPKAEIRQLERFGREKDNLSNVENRTGPRASIGYWWRAYDWRNYLLSCGNCNSKWKKTFFPVKEDPRAVFQVVATNNDHPLVIHPFGRARPEVNLRFRRDASVTGLSPKGRETIRVCGLDRPSLRGARRERTEQSVDLIDALRLAFADDEARVRDLLRRLHRIGAARNSYAGVTRSMVKHEPDIDLDWSDVKEFVVADFVEQIEAAPSPARRLTEIQRLKARHEDFDRPEALDDALIAAFGQTANDLTAELDSP